MELSILFWFYKQPTLCRNRLQLIKHHNPNAKVYGLYGGSLPQMATFKRKLGGYLNDFYTSPYKSPRWKWRNGDLMLLDWYKVRGKDLKWDSVVVIQWDTLVFASLNEVFRGIKRNEIFLSGLRPLSKKVALNWCWTRPEYEDRKNYLKFLNHVRREYHYTEQPLCCQFVLQVFPRLFFEKYITVKNRTLGFLEYRVPTYAKILNIPFYKRDLGTWWFDTTSNRSMNAIPREIDDAFVRRQLSKKGGWRIFHPYYREWKKPKGFPKE